MKANEAGKIRPCPFCGTRASVHRDIGISVIRVDENSKMPGVSGECFYCECFYCGGRTGYSGDRESAIFKWNQRGEPGCRNLNAVIDEIDAMTDDEWEEKLCETGEMMDKYKAMSHGEKLKLLEDIGIYIN